MASGKLSPRQKMINLMYLVFIAMLALQMSKEVLVGFGIVNETVNKTNETFIQKNKEALNSLAIKASESPEQFKSVYANASQISQVSNKYYQYLDSLKTYFLSSYEDKNDYESMDKGSVVDETFKVSGKLTNDGRKFMSKMESYRNSMLNLIGNDYPNVKKNIEETFLTSDAKIKDNDGKTMDYIQYHYIGYPLISTITKLSTLQNNIKISENEILSQMFSGQLVEIASMNNYSTLLESERSAVYPGNKFDGNIVLGRTDSTTVPTFVDLKLDGRQLEKGKDFDIVGGKVKLNVTAGNPGEHKIEGKLVFAQEDTEDIEVPVEQTFQVIPKPNQAIVSADKMNVVYRGIDNPITVSMPGVPENNISASAPGHTFRKKSGSTYILKPGAGKDLGIKVNGTIEGETFSSTTKFRIKSLPRPTPTIRGQVAQGGAIKLPRKAVEISPVGAIFEDFDFDISPVVKRFTMSVPGQASVVVNGDRLNAQAKKTLALAKTGDIIQFFDIRADVPGAQVNVKSMPALLVQITN
ncbi:type IX secretion system motor protein PorM/GldM [Flavobacteriaceae bacterium 14752]|uniref:type IX secretion system motor protein PorM/GldM n=1 Tax=Mesohalobacter salilacus TaxID=2491711 RepID=UPI000F633AE0|nr:gliding motility protein GldM [Flavobacteriaceae bacterium 14752]